MFVIVGVVLSTRPKISQPIRFKKHAPTKKNLSKSSLDIELLSPEEVLLKHPPILPPQKNATSFKVHKFHVFRSIIISPQNLKPILGVRSAGFLQ